MNYRSEGLKVWGLQGSTLSRRSGLSVGGGVTVREIEPEDWRGLEPREEC